MSSEEDTFRLLKKVPFGELDYLYGEYLWNNKELANAAYSDSKTYKKLIDVFFSTHGWTRQEYLDAHTEYHERRGNLPKT